MSVKEKVFKFLKSIEQTGVTPDLSFFEQLRVELSNIILMGYFTGAIIDLCFRIFHN